MKKYLLTLILILGVAANAQAGFIGNLTADTSPSGTDLMETEKDPSGTPVSRKVTLEDAITKAHGLSDGNVQITGGVMAIGGVGSGSVTTIKEGGVQVGGADIAIIDFGPGFDVAETPDTEVNITLDLTEKQVNLTTEVTGVLPDANVADDITITNIAQVGDITASASEINTPLDGALVTLTEFRELEAIGATTLSANQWALLGGLAETLTAAEVNILDGVTGVTAAELTYINDVTSDIQAQLDGKEGTLTNSAGLAAALSDETGTGAAVLANSPALVTPDLGTPSAAVLTNATGLPSGGITTIVESIYWPAAAISADGTQCADPAQAVINSGPEIYTIICTDNDASQMEGHVNMPDGWDAGTVAFTLEYIQTAADTSALNADVKAMCRGAGETVNSTFGSEVAIDDAAVTGSNAIDQTDSAAVTANGTCAAGDSLFWRIELDATGTTTAVATLHFVGVKMEYTSNVGD